MSSSENPFLQNLQRLHTHLWGQNVINVVQGGGKSYSTIDLTHFEYIPQNTSHDNILLVREEYKLAYDYILADTLRDRNCLWKSAFIVTGQEGIGKTLFLLYLLVRRLQERQPVAFQIAVKEFALFDERGVTLKATSFESTFGIPEGTWALSDLSYTESRPCEAFSIRQAHLVYTSTPDYRRWKRLEKVAVREYVMDVWSLEELRTLLTVNNLDVQQGMALFRKYGPNPRTIVNILQRPSMEESYLLYDLKYGASQVACDLQKVTNRFRLLDINSDICFTPSILTIRPDLSPLRRPVAYIPTQFLASALGVAVSHLLLADRQRDFFTAPLGISDPTLNRCHPALHKTVRWLFENYAHICISSSKCPPLVVYCPQDPIALFIPAPGTMITGSTALKGMQPPFDFYWRPREPNFDGVNALIGSGNVVWVLQFTMSTSPNSAMKDLDQVRGIMNHNDKANVEWRLVLVGLDLRTMEMARECQKKLLTGRWEKTPVYACELLFKMFDEDDVERLKAILNEDNEVYPIAQRVESDV